MTRVTRRAYKKGGKVEGAIWHERDAFDEGGDVRMGDTPNMARADAERQTSTPETRGEPRENNNVGDAFGRGVSDAASAVGNFFFSPAEAKENPPQIGRQFLAPGETINAAMGSGRQDMAPQGLIRGQGTQQDTEQANAAEAAAEKMNTAFGAPIGATTAFGSGVSIPGSTFEPKRSATGTPSESLLAAIQPKENIITNPYDQGQMPQPTNLANQANDFQKIADQYKHSADQGILGMQGYNVGTYANQMPQPTNVATTIGANDYANQMPQPIGSADTNNPYSQGQMPQPSGGVSNANIRSVRDAITQNMGGNAPSTPAQPVQSPAPVQSTAPVKSTAPAATQPMPTANNVPMPPIPASDLQGPKWVEGLLGLVGLNTQQHLDRLYNNYTNQGLGPTDAYNKSISDIQDMRKPTSGPDRGGERTQKIQKLMPDGTYQWVDQPFNKGGVAKSSRSLHNNAIVEQALHKISAPLPALDQPLMAAKAGRRY